MADNNKWLQRVVVKLNQLHMNGSDFEDRRWIFDWDDKLSIKDNLDNVSDEDRAIETLTQSKILKTRTYENWYRNQYLDAQDELEIAKSLNPDIPKWMKNTVWGDWDSTDSAHREYDWLRYLDEFDYDRFQQFCETHGLNPNLTETKQLKSTKQKGDDEILSPEPNSIKLHPLEIRHYSIRKGILTLNPTTDVAIATKGKTKRPDGEKYIQCAVMEKLFKKVNNIKNGITFGQALTVNDNKIGKKEEKEIRNAVYEINKKVASVGGPDNLVKIQNKKVFVNNSYLE